jgi:hypothetical protein
MFVARNCPAPFEPDTMMKSFAPPNAPVALPPLVAAYVEATNSFDLIVCRPILGGLHHQYARI